MNQTEQKMMDILKYISDYSLENGFPPSVREIGAAFKIKSTATTYYYLEKLEQQGFIRKSPSKKRAMEVIRGPYATTSRGDMTQIPLVGKITAGIPIEAVENLEDTFTFPNGLFARGDLFMLTVSGDSMIEAGIFDKDKIVVRKQVNAENGDIVVAMMNGEATVKYFYRGKDNYILRPANPVYQDIIVKNLEILGIVVGLIRTFR